MLTFQQSIQARRKSCYMCHCLSYGKSVYRGGNGHQWVSSSQVPIACQHSTVGLAIRCKANFTAVSTPKSPFPIRDTDTPVTCTKTGISQARSQTFPKVGSPECILRLIKLGVSGGAVSGNLSKTSGAKALT